MGSYVVLARKWRPSQFSDVVGQGPVVRTLMNAIRAERIHQAYLFNGSRGIGKTSIARIFAKVLRCENTRSDGDWLKSCDECANCREIAAGNGIDVLEIDGASNNGVEAVREIRENARFMPSSGSRKIYIIDEVHMLTTQAFNALLKTLEEPPAHVVFVFATTEPHKIPATILSRCQRFDFKRVTLAQIQERLSVVTRAENIEAEGGALGLIARAAEGSMRDALSLLDQVIAFSGNHLTLQAIRESISLIEGETLLGILRGVFARKPLESLASVEEAYSKGHDLRVLTRGLIEFLHAAILAKVGATGPASLEQISLDEWNELKRISESRSLEEIELIFQVLHHGLEWIARSPQPKIVLDVLLIKCAAADSLIYPGQAQAGSTGSKGTKPSAQVSPGVPNAQATSSPQSLANPQAIANLQPLTGSRFTSTLQAPAPVSAESTNHSAAPVPSKVDSRTEGQPLSWDGFVEHIRKTRPLLATLLEHVNAFALPEPGEARVMISFSPKDVYFRDQLQARVYHEQLLTLSKEYFGLPVRVQLELKEEGESLAARKERLQVEKRQATRDAAQNHPIIREAKALFGGELGPIELMESDG